MLPIRLPSSAGYILRKMSAVSPLTGLSQLSGTWSDEQSCFRDVSSVGVSGHVFQRIVLFGERRIPRSWSQF